MTCGGVLGRVGAPVGARSTGLVRVLTDCANLSSYALKGLLLGCYNAGSPLGADTYLGSPSRQHSQQQLLQRLLKPRSAGVDRSPRLWPLGSLASQPEQSWPALTAVHFCKIFLIFFKSYLMTSSVVEDMFD